MRRAIEHVASSECVVKLDTRPSQAYFSTELHVIKVNASGKLESRPMEPDLSKKNDHPGLVTVSHSVRFLISRI